MVNYNFDINRTTSNNLFNFALLYGRLSNTQNPKFLHLLAEENVKRADLSAVSIDKNILDKTDLEDLDIEKLGKFYDSELKKEFYSYTKAKLDIIKTISSIDLDLIKELHSTITAKTNTFRKQKRLLPKIVNQNSVKKEIQLEVKTPPHQIKEKLEELIDWINLNLHSENPAILAGLTHFHIVEIHPFDDGNGRLGKILEYAIMKVMGMNIVDYVATETYYLANRERYYQIIEDAIESRDLTEWLEFYSEALLSSITFNAKLLFKYSGGAIDIVNNKFVQLSSIEEEIIELIRTLDLPSPTEIAKKLGTSRQNVFYSFKNLHQKGLLEKIGKNTAARYRLKIS